MLILASKSPRRRELLELAGIPYSCIPSQADEEIPAGMPSEMVPEYLAVKKAEEVLGQNEDAVVLGSDTLVLLEGEPLGKPHSEEEAFAMLRRLSGKTHQVCTGVAILSRGKRVSFTSMTEVEFYALSDEEIRDYIATGEPMDKAGAYGIQGRGALLVKEIRGDYYTVVGLPIAETVRVLKQFIY